jgi:hypothetical protein
VKEMTASVNDMLRWPIADGDRLPGPLSAISPKLAQWQHDEWGHLRPGDSVESELVRRVMAEAASQKVPTLYLYNRPE